MVVPPVRMEDASLHARSVPYRMVPRASDLASAQRYPIGVLILRADEGTWGMSAHGDKFHLLYSCSLARQGGGVFSKRVNELDPLARVPAARQLRLAGETARPAIAC
jgi:hypothetical protein